MTPTDDNAGEMPDETGDFQEPFIMHKSLEEMQREVFEWAESKGWNDPGPIFGEAIALLHSECSEALEEFRVHGLNRYVERVSVEGACIVEYEPPLDYEGFKPEGVPSEFADILIRLCHYAQLFGIDLEAEYEAKMTYNKTRKYRHGGKKL